MKKTTTTEKTTWTLNGVVYAFVLADQEQATAFVTLHPFGGYTHFRFFSRENAEEFVDMKMKELLN